MIANRAESRAGRRRGFGLIEMAVGAMLLVAAMAVTAQVIAWVALERRAAERRERAVFEAANLLERVAARPWAEIESAPPAGLKMAEATTRFLPGSSLDLKVASFADAPTRKRITVEVRWLDRSGRPEAPVRLVAWAYRPGKGTP